MPTNNQYKRARYDAGLCVNCASPRDTDRQLCADCRAKSAQYFKQLASSRARQGLCRCGSNANIFEGVPICTNCWFKRIALMTTGSKRNGQAIQLLFEQQRGKCAYSDELLIPGQNACIDHKVPRSRGGTNDIDNLQWVTKTINRIKGTMTHEEFVALCCHIAHKHT